MNRATRRCSDALSSTCRHRSFHESPSFIKAQTKFSATPKEGDELSKMSRLQQNVASHMQYTWTVAPHVSTVTQIDMSAVVARRLALKEEFEARGNGKLTFTHFLAHSAIGAIKEHRTFNVSIAEPNKIIHHKDVNLSFAVASDDGGLLVPVIKGAQDMSLADVATQMNEIAIAARGRKLPVDMLRGGTFTLTNVGTFGNLISTPLINQPPVVEEKAGEEDAIVIKPMMFATLTYDHRVNNGSKSGRFFKHFRDHLESYPHGLDN